MKPALTKCKKYLLHMKLNKKFKYSVKNLNLLCLHNHLAYNSFINNPSRGMKLITHNMLTSSAMKNVKEGFPLKIVADELKTVEVEYRPEFLTRMLTKINWDAFVYGAKCIGQEEELPVTLPSDFEQNGNLLKKIHHILLEVEVISGILECPESKRQFRISNGIPNMLLNEDEV